MTMHASAKGYAAVNGINLYYEIYGTGQPTVLLHGGLGAIEMFGPVLPLLAEGRQIIAVDLQAHGRTADIDRPISLEAMADDVVGLIQHLGVVQADIVGYSMGAGVAVQAAIHYPQHVRKLVVVSFPFKRTGWYPEIQAGMGQMSAAAAEPMKQTPMYGMYAQIAPRPDDWPVLLEKMGQLLREDYDYSAGIQALTTPMLIVVGDADSVRTAHAVEFFELRGGGQKDGSWDGSGLSNAQLAILPGMTHYTIFASPALAAVTIPFLDAPIRSSAPRDLVVTRVFNASVQQVWDAWTKPEHVMQWWGPTGFTCPLAQMDVLEGGQSLVCMRAPKEFGGQDYYNLWFYEKIVPLERIEFVVSFADAEGNRVDPATLGLPPGMPSDVRQMVTFKALGAHQTEMTMIEYGYTSDQIFDLSKAGLEQCLDKMAASFG